MKPLDILQIREEQKNRTDFMPGGIVLSPDNLDVINAAIEQVKSYQYRPAASWISFDGETFYITTDGTDLSDRARIIEKLKA